MSTNLILYVARDLRFAWVHEDLATAETVGIVFVGDGHAGEGGKETRCYRLSVAMWDEITREMLRVEDEYFAGGGGVSERKYQRAVERWIAMRAEVDKANLTAATPPATSSHP